MVIPLFVGREKSILALDEAMKGGKQILLVAQKRAEIDEPGANDLHRIGVLATVLQLLKLPDGTVKVLVEGGQRARIQKLKSGDHFVAEVEMIDEDAGYDEREVDVLMRSVMSLFDQYVKLNKKVPPEILTSLAGIDSPSRLADTIAAHMTLKIEEKQKLLELESVRERLEHVMALIDGEIDLM
ncbi:MAG: LON peptidase substrate-binding domain-containing protein, partial [Proteobacteria bacterium]|nr:LON peptidase substrate-binding domain-containing protein [Pseudomonadota bacterium]